MRQVIPTRTEVMYNWNCIRINQIMPSGFFGQIHFQFQVMSGLFYYSYVLQNFLHFNANDVDLDQTPHKPHYAASVPVLHYLAMPLLLDSRHKWVKGNSFKPHSTSYIQHDKINKNPNICFERSEELRRDSKHEFELAMVNTPSVYIILRKR